MHSVTKNCSDLSLEQFFLTIGQNNFGNKIPFQAAKIFFAVQMALASINLKGVSTNSEHIFLFGPFRP